MISTLHPGSNLTVRKGSTVKLACNATGFPEPEISWEREVRPHLGGNFEKELMMMLE